MFVMWSIWHEPFTHHNDIVPSSPWALTRKKTFFSHTPHACPPPLAVNVTLSILSVNMVATLKYFRLPLFKVRQYAPLKPTSTRNSGRMSCGQIGKAIDKHDSGRATAVFCPKIYSSQWKTVVSRFSRAFFVPAIFHEAKRIMWGRVEFMSLCSSFSMFPQWFNVASLLFFSRGIIRCVRMDGLQQYFYIVYTRFRTLILGSEWSRTSSLFTEQQKQPKLPIHLNSMPFYRIASFQFSGKLFPFFGNEFIRIDISGWTASFSS